MPMDDPRGFPITMTRLRWVHVGALVAAAAGLFLPWVDAGTLSVRALGTTPGRVFIVVLVLTVLFAYWHGVRTSNYWYSMDTNRLTGTLVSLSWLVLLALAVYESVHVASAHSPTGKAQVVGFGLALDAVATVIGFVVATVDAVQNWSQSRVIERSEREEQAESAARIRLLRPIGAWALAAVGILAVAGAGLAGHNAGWTPIVTAKPVSHTTHRSSLHTGSTTRQPGTSGSGAPTTGAAGTPGGATTTPTTAPPSGNTGGTGNTGNTGAAFPDGAAGTPPVDGVVPPAGIGNTPPYYGITPTPPVTSGGNTGTTGDTGGTGNTGDTGDTGNTG